MYQSYLDPPEDVTGPYAVAPIQAAAPAPRRGLAWLTALGTPVLLAGLFGGPAARRPPGPHQETRESLRVQLAEFTEPRPAPKVLSDPLPKAPPGPGQGQGLPGTGHLEGNGAVDPLLQPFLRRNGGEVPVPEVPVRAEPDSAGLLGDASLPVAKGGNGLARGTGRDPGRGGGGGLPREELQPDYRLVLVHEEPARSDLKSDDPSLAQPVLVRVRIGEDGVPLSATALSGPPQLFDVCVRTALRFRWEPLAPHGLKAPQVITITFRPFLMRPRPYR